MQLSTFFRTLLPIFVIIWFYVQISTLSFQFSFEIFFFFVDFKIRFLLLLRLPKVKWNFLFNFFAGFGLLNLKFGSYCSIKEYFTDFCYYINFYALQDGREHPLPRSQRTWQAPKMMLIKNEQIFHLQFFSLIVKNYLLEKFSLWETNIEWGWKRRKISLKIIPKN